MIRYALLLLILLPPMLLFAQRDSLPYKNVLSLAPLRLIDPANSGIELAFEHRHKPARSTQLIAAYMTPAFSTRKHWQHYNGFRVGVDERFYSRRTNSRLFGAIGFVWNNANFLYPGNYKTTVDSFGHYDTVHLHQTNLIWNLTYGVQASLSPRLVFDFSTGIGLKYRRIKQDEPGTLLERETEWLNFDSFYRQGHTWTVTFPGIIRLGYRF